MAFEQQVAGPGFGIITHIFALFLKAKDTLKPEVKRNFQWVIKGTEVCLDVTLSNFVSFGLRLGLGILGWF